MRARLVVLSLLELGCSRTQPAGGGTASGAKVDAPAAEPVRPSSPASCTIPGGVACRRFDAPEDAVRWVLAKEPLVLGVGEAHAQRGTEGVASATKRFTESLLPVIAPRASDVVVELWAPDPTCAKEVERTARAQEPVTDAQASTNQNEFVTLGVRAKAAGVTPWLLRPTCDDFARIAAAGEDAVSVMLGLVKRLTLAKVVQLHERSRAASPDDPKMVVAYGGAMHNDHAPPDEAKDLSFGPELDRWTGGRYVELDLIVPEFVKKSPAWEKLPWYASFEAERASGRPLDRPMLYLVGERSFVLVFAASPAATPATRLGPEPTAKPITRPAARPVTNPAATPVTAE